MASHFTSLGFKISDMEDFQNHFRLVYQNGEKISCELGTYIKWSVGNGVELWGQIDKNGAAIGLNPHFIGNSKTTVKLESKVIREDDTMLDGAFHCWSDPQRINSDEGAYPFVFDSPDICTYKDIKTPQIVNAQITGFAHEISAYKNEEEFQNSQKNEPNFASKSFIPAGLFKPNGDNVDSPRAMAIFTGHVLETSSCKNPHSENEFIWARVSTLGAEFDIVIDPEILEGQIKVGAIVSGMFWLSGRIIGDYDKVEKGFRLSNLFKKK
ncbi:MAG: hypothetical protein FH761_11310 [Firmicutes bacterium]|nr:hypothetical protein [Bacillota bacterium]